MSRKISQSSVSAYFGMSAASDFEIRTFDNCLPLPEKKTNYSHCMIAVCFEGEAEFSVISEKHVFRKNQVMCIFPGHFVSLESVSDDFKVSWCVISKSFMIDLTSRFPNILFDYLTTFPNYNMSDVAMEEAEKYFDLMMDKMSEEGNMFQKDIIFNILYCFLLDMYNIINRKIPNMPIGKTANERIFDRFHVLVSNHIKENQPITFYAEALNISSKHLSKVVKELKGISVKRWLDMRMILELKQTLLTTSESLKEISLQYDFSSCDSMHHFFKKHTGVSPSEYRHNGGEK